MNIQGRYTIRSTVYGIAALVATGCAVTPATITHEERMQRMEADFVNLFSKQEAVTAPVDMYDAMARALKYNLDHRVKLMERAVANGVADVSRYSMLPSLTANAGYFDRNNDSGASSRSLLTNTQSLEPSTSQERGRNTADLHVVWNVLDFGVSYAQAQQKANEALIHQEQLRKVTNNIIQEVRSSFWRALAAQQLLPEMDDLLDRAESALRRSREMENLRIQDPMKALNYQQSLLKIISQMWKMREELSTAKSELAALINIKPGTQFELADSSRAINSVKRVLTPLDKLETMALTQRPELSEADYMSRMDALEVRIAMLRMFPGLEINIGRNYDSNDYLFNNTWSDAGLRLSWNLFNIFSGPASIDLAKARQELGESRRLALNMAVLTQVNVSYQNYHLSLKSQDIARQQYEVESRVLEQTLAKQQAARESELETLKARASALSAKMRLHMTEAETQNAIGRLVSSVGIDPLPKTINDTGIGPLSDAIQEHVNSWIGELETGEDGTAAPTDKTNATH